MELVQKSKPKKTIIILTVIILAIIGFILYQMLRYKPLPPEVSKNGQILETPFNGFRKYPTDPIKY